MCLIWKRKESDYTLITNNFLFRFPQTLFFIKHCLISRLSTWRDICKRTLSGHWILPRNSEAKAATQQNDNTQNAKHHDAYNVPINEYRLASAPCQHSTFLTIILSRWELPSPARLCSRATIFRCLPPLQSNPPKLTTMGISHYFFSLHFESHLTALCLECAQPQEWKRKSERAIDDVLILFAKW